MGMLERRERLEGFLAQKPKRGVGREETHSHRHTHKSRQPHFPGNVSPAV